MKNYNYNKPYLLIIIKLFFFNFQEGYGAIKSDVVDYFKLSDIEIEEYFKSMSDEYLLSREKELLDEMT